MRKQSTALFRALRLACHMVYGMLLAIVYPTLRLSARRRILQRWSRELLAILHIRLEISGHMPPCHGNMLVANHISWLDVLAISAFLPACFIAKSEVRNWPLIGTLCQRARTVFIERDIRRDTLRINRQIGELIAEGENVAFFPEGTSTDGTQTGHFHSSLFQSAIDCTAAIQPIAVRYHDGSGKHCPDAAFVDDMSFVDSLRNVLFSPSLHVTLIFPPALSCAAENRRTLAAKAQAAIGSALVEHAACHYLDPHATTSFETPRTAFQSAYSLLLDPVFKLRKRHPG